MSSFRLLSMELSRRIAKLKSIY